MSLSTDKPDLPLALKFFDFALLNSGYMFCKIDHYKVYLKFDLSWKIVIGADFWLVNFEKNVCEKYFFAFFPERAAEGGPIILRISKGPTISFNGDDTYTKEHLNEAEVPFWSNDFGSWLLETAQTKLELENNPVSKMPSD